MRKFTGAGEFYWAPALLSVASVADIIERDRGDNFDWIREQFLDQYYLNSALTVSAKI